MAEGIVDDVFTTEESKKFNFHITNGSLYEGEKWLCSVTMEPFCYIDSRISSYSEKDKRDAFINLVSAWYHHLLPKDFVHCVRVSKE